MANPQPNKFVRISTELFEALCRIRIPSEARRVLDVIIRKTYGWNKKSDRISLSQFHLATGLHKANISRALRTLLKMNLIIKDDNPKGYIYRYNKDYATWKPLSYTTPIIKGDKKRYRPRQSALSGTIPTKDTITKDTNTIDNKEKHLTYVYLTKDEYQALIGKWGVSIIGEMIERLNDYIEQIGVVKAKNKYKSHAAVIRNWLRKDGRTPPPKRIYTPPPEPKPPKKYSPEEIAKGEEARKKFFGLKDKIGNIPDSTIKPRRRR